MTLKKFIGQTHLWLGLASGLVVFILGTTGSIYSFEDEIRPLVYKDRLFVNIPANAVRLPFTVIRANAQQALGKAYPLIDGEVSMLPGYTVSFLARKFDYNAIWYNNFYRYYYHVYVNPYTGKVVKVENSKWEFFNFDIALHTSLLLGDPGRLVIEYSTLVFVVLLITGIVLWWPKNKKTAKQRFLFRWKGATQFKPKNYDLHNILGFYVLLITLVVGLTGLVWSFDWAASSVQWLANGGKKNAIPKEVLCDSTNTKTASLDLILNDAVRRWTEADDFFISFPADNKGTVSVFARTNGEPEYKSGNSEYDQHNAALLSSRSFREMSRGEKIMAMNYDLHTGSILGLPGKVLIFFGGLIAASLPVTGFLICWSKRKNNNRQAKPVTMIRRRRSFEN